MKMVDGISAHLGRVGRMAAFVGALAGLCASLAVFTAPPAHAEQFCWGAVLSNEKSCEGRLRFGSEVRGMGKEKSVCVAIAPFGPIKCSSGPGVWVSTNYGTNLEGKGWIADNAAGTTTVFGEIF
jgi:hypothetical protein